MSILTAQVLLSVLATLLACGLWWLYAFEYDRYRVHLFRHRLFVIRDDLFDAAKAGRIAFNSPAYRTTWETLNAMLRSAHALTFLEYVVFIFVAKRFKIDIEQTEYARYGCAVTDLSPAERDLILGVYGKAHRALFSHWMHTNIITFPLALLVDLLLYLVPSFRSPLAKVLTGWSAWHKLDTVANVIGHTDGAYRAYV